jgi:hypothetical protein
MCLATVALSSLGTLAQCTAAQNPPGQKIDVTIIPDITIQTEDYADARKKFHTKLLREGRPHIRTAKHPSHLLAFPKSMGGRKNTLRYLRNPQQTSRESTDSMFRPSRLKAVTPVQRMLKCEWRSASFAK